MINYSKQNITKGDISAVVKTLKSNYITTGPNTLLFEKKFKNKIKLKYALSCSSGTAGVHLFIVTFNLDSVKINRDKIIQYLYKHKIVKQVHYIPINKHPYYKKYSHFIFKGANKYFKSCL